MASPPERPRLWALRIAYLPDGFHGYARQPDRPTVEGTLRSGLVRRGALAPEDEASFQSASRTDRGVSALANVVAFPSRRTGGELARMVGSFHPHVLATGYAEVPPEFRARSATWRSYAYLWPGAPGELAAWREGAQLFVGEHDFTSFSRRDDPPRPPRRVVTSCSVRDVAGVRIVEVRAPSFLWGQVRKMVAALGALAQGRLSHAAVEGALRGQRPLQLPLAPAGGLVLTRVAYDFDFVDFRPARRALARLEAEALDARWRATLRGWFQARLGDDPSDA